ncbi:hypothetical protein CHH28_08725 [Bacterioplanes sanyensis]|uniref:Lipoprotein n=1 Tax=Bacterioplanes sanyensis TaxID=1249553 RepID=A0A222FJ09_9GAMM|nr:hypothetical protein [Bacterioplanes sanyensis]ASP38760.1 hypothetical protein CHH28_08725 [Bacterioplanes sanyensis]
MNTRYTLLATAVAAALTSGCASTPKDTTPLRETAVLQSKYSLAASMLPDSRGTQTVYTRPDRRRIDYTFKFDNWFMNSMFGGSDTSDIARLDNNLLWLLDNDDETYKECPLTGCGASLWEVMQEKMEGGEMEQEEDGYDPSAGGSCELTPLKTTFKVTPKAKGRVVNGFNADQYIASWEMGVKDQHGNVDKNLFTLDLWMVDATSTMQRSWEINGQFQERYLAKVAGDNPMAKFLSNDVYKVISGITGDTDKSQLTSQSPIVKKLNAIEGYPVSLKFEWYVESNTCPEERRQQAQAQNQGNDDGGFGGGMGSIGSIAGSLLQEQASKQATDYFTPDPNEPVLTYIYDVTSLEVSQQRDSRFNVPADYDLTDRR